MNQGNEQHDTSFNTDKNTQIHRHEIQPLLCI